MSDKQELELVNLEVSELEDGDLEGVAGGVDATNICNANFPCRPNASCEIL